MTKPRNLPRIACFHGGGSNSTIYEVQCAQLSRLLENEFELVYFDGPFLRTPGPGILPAFEDFAPFRSWFKTDGNETEQGDGSGYDFSGRDGVERVWRLMGEAGPGGDWVGVMGFSQGSRIAGGLLLDQQRRVAMGEELGGRPVLKFGVMCMGGGVPMVSEVGYKMGDASEMIEIPTLHVHGLKDNFLSLGRQQYAAYYSPKTKRLYEVDYHHAMPWVKHEVQGLADHIRQIYWDTE
ncbi:serine hydrolase FSH [Aspergillus avenaceus]|uniref:Serine hydrolase FSH n=1 Tax=Aspergillus avenaceus TaxID=36643 RepID=A0A5N6U571_ASPAV|nr:serine hydrolase FSH [Aspergillus avenaceus]